MNSISRIFLPFSILCLLTLCAFVSIPSTDWNIAPNFEIRFTSEDPSGTFTEFGGDIAFDPADLASSKFDVTVKAASINTGNGMKNKHARSDEWLDAEKYPNIRFVSESFAKTTSGYAVTGTLELHGVKKTITIPFTFRDDTFSGSFKVNRADYGVGKTTGMSGKVSRELTIDFSVPVTAK